jgi:glycosyltransferase involved in cell wall biosynthesis
MRVAFLTPLPPAPTGIADYAAEVLALLTGHHEIEVFHAQDRLEADRLPRSLAVHHAAGFLPRHRARPYDLAVYQMGNAVAHAFLYEPLARVPGLLVLHDLVLHHARARAFLESEEAIAYARDPSDPARRAAALPRLQAYSDELAYSYPAQAARLFEAHLNTVGDLLPYAYPLFRLPVEASRATAVHNRFMAEAVRAEVPGARTVRIPMTAGRAAVGPEAVRALRASYGIDEDEIVVGCFGLLTREKRIETVARAVARAAVHLPRLRLLLVGPVGDGPGLDALLSRLGVAARTVATGRVPFWTLAAHMEAADLVVHLRYPTARETSAALLRVLAQGRPAIVSDLEHLADVPDDAVARVDLTDEEGGVTHAILRLVESPAARRRLGEAARAFVEREHSPARCRDGYLEAIEAASRLPDPAPRAWPDHWSRPERSERGDGRRGD